MDSTIQAMQTEDWPSVRKIYAEGIATGNATFETNVPQWEAWDKAHLQECRLVARIGADVVGWAVLALVSSRCVYAGVAENSIYISEKTRGKGIGKTLLAALVEESERAGFWTLQTGIFPENTVSIAIHKACGFREIGRRGRIGQMNGIWRDVMLLERRSTVVGV